MQIHPASVTKRQPAGSSRAALSGVPCRPGAVRMHRLGLAESERVGLRAGVEEGDLEGVVGDGAGLADELVEPRLGDRAVAVAVHIASMRGAGRLPIEEHTEPQGS